jgi:cold shock protein
MAQKQQVQQHPAQHPAGAPATEGRATGTVKRLVVDKNFGFIRDGNGVEYFFHASALRGPLGFNDIREGDSVLFVPGQGDKGPRANDVEVVNQAGA